MIERHTMLAASAALILGLVIGCGSPPLEEVDAARSALENARAEDADVWAPVKFGVAEGALNAARTEITAQEDKWFKSYGNARELLSTAREQAAQATQAAVANREQFRSDAEKTLASADEALRAAEAGLGGSRGDAALFRSDIAQLGTSISAAREVLQTGDFRKALESATSIEERAIAIQTQVEESQRGRRPRPEK